MSTSNVRIEEKHGDQLNKRISIEYRSIDSLKLDSNNPRQHSKKQIRQLAKSISTFGFVTPIGVDSDLNVIFGHGRLLGGREAGVIKVPTVCLDHLNRAQIKAYALADNKLAENATWSAQLLAKQFQILIDADIALDLEVTGFETAEIDFVMESYSVESLRKSGDPADAIPELSDGPVVNVAGDLWALDEHRLLCANALEPNNFEKLLGGKKASAVFVDPPFNLKIEDCVSGLGKVKHKDFAMAVGEMTEAEFISFLRQCCKLLVDHSLNGSIHFICMDWRHSFELQSAARGLYDELKNICVWAKDRAGMGSMYRSQHELVFVYKSGKGRHRNNVQLGRFGRHRTNVWQFPSASTFSKSSEEGNLLHIHPTAKSVAMVAEAVLDVTSRGDIVLDTFLGSGTTLMAAERTRRVCYAMELDPVYVDTAIRRWQKFTGQAAQHVTSGRTFSEIEAEKGGCNVKR